MNSFYSDANGRVHILHLSPGEDLLQGILDFIKQENIRYGVVMSGIGTLSKCRFHGVTTAHLPAHDEFYDIPDKPAEFAGLAGIIADYEPHLHMSLTIFDNGFQSVTAHLEPGCRVLCLAEISILELDNVHMCRSMDENGIRQLNGHYLCTSSDAAK